MGWSALLDFNQLKVKAVNDLWRDSRTPVPNCGPITAGIEWILSRNHCSELTLRAKRVILRSVLPDPLNPFLAGGVSICIMGRFLSRFLKPGVPVCLLAIVLLWSPCARGFGFPYFRQHSVHQLVVGYFPQWGIYNPQPYYVKTLVINGSAAHLDQINYSQGSVSGGRCSLADPGADLNTTYTAETSVDGLPDRPNSPFRGYFH